MLRFDATTPLVGALAAANAYAPEAHAHGAAVTLLQPAMVAIRHAQVEIYCDHDRQAIADIHTARNSLLASPHSVPFEAFAALDQAVWQMRQHDFAAAEKALERALNHLQPGTPS